MPRASRAHRAAALGFAGRCRAGLEDAGVEVRHVKLQGAWLPRASIRTLQSSRSCGHGGRARRSAPVQTGRLLRTGRHVRGTAQTPAGHPLRPGRPRGPAWLGRHGVALAGRGIAPGMAGAVGDAPRRSSDRRQPLSAKIWHVRPACRRSASRTRPTDAKGPMSPWEEADWLARRESTRTRVWHRQRNAGGALVHPLPRVRSGARRPDTGADRRGRSQRAHPCRLAPACSAQARWTRILASDSHLHARVQNLGWLPADEWENVAMAADVGLLPLDDTRIHRARCPAKLPRMMALGLPVVAHDIGEAATYLDDESAGRRIPPDGDALFAHAVLELLQQQQIAPCTVCRNQPALPQTPGVGTRWPAGLIWRISAVWCITGDIQIHIVRDERMPDSHAQHNQSPV